MNPPGSITHLEDEGFDGFLTVGQLHADQCATVPDARGVYVVIRESGETPRFLARSTAPSWRGMDPTRPVEDLAERWVPGAPLLYVASAPGPGVRHLLRQRVKRLLRFGHGRVVGHWGGRLVWQLGDRSALRVAWQATGDDDPEPIATRLLERFVRHFGRPPFANDGLEGND